MVRELREGGGEGGRVGRFDFSIPKTNVRRVYILKFFHATKDVWVEKSYMTANIYPIVLQ